MVNLTLDNKVRIHVMYKTDNNGDNIPLVVSTDWGTFIHDMKHVIIKDIHERMTGLYDDKKHRVLMECLTMSTRLKYNNIDDVALMSVSNELGFKMSINYIDVFN